MGNTQLEMLAKPIPIIALKQEPRLEHLYDSKGQLYGIGPVGGWEGINERAIGMPVSAMQMIIRPDCGETVKPSLTGAVMQTIPSLSRLWDHSAEGRICRCIHNVMLEKVGLSIALGRGDWWSDNHEKKRENRARYHTLKRIAIGAGNKLVARLLSEAADQRTLTTARRFSLKFRGELYQALAEDGERAAQLAEVFPVLAAKVYLSFEYRRVASAVLNDDQRRDLRAMVRRGAPLKHIAEAASVPMAWRKVKPGAAIKAFLKFNVNRFPAEWIHAWLPASTAQQLLWVSLVPWAYNKGGPPFAEWLGKHIPELGKTKEAVTGDASDIFDWVKACYIASVPPHVRVAITDVPISAIQSKGEQFVTRHFNKDMELRTVRKLAHEWHEAVADGMEGSENVQFPPPWFPPGEINGYSVSPITDSAGLYREGHEMRHCVATYSDEIRYRQSYIYSVTLQGKKAATLELRIVGNEAIIGQFAGKQNSRPPEALKRAVRRWLTDSKRKHGKTGAWSPRVKPERTFSLVGPAGDFDDDIPF